MFSVQEINAEKGRGCVATERIPAGTLILKATPCAFVVKAALRRQVCHRCLRTASSLGKEAFQRCARCKVACYCSRECQAADWGRGGHQGECARLVALAPKVPTETVFLAARVLALRETAPATWAKVEGLCCAPQRGKQSMEAAQRYMAMSVMTADFLGSERLRALAGSGEALVGLLSKLETNAFNVCDGDLQPVGIGVYPDASLLNHSCRPNASTVFEGTALYVAAARDIAPGEEITISYIDLGADLEHRRAELRQGFGFVCACERCLDEEHNRSPQAQEVHALRTQDGKELAERRRRRALDKSREAAERRAKGDNAGARALWEEAYRAQAAVLHPMNVELLPTLNGLVGCCVAAGDWDAAARYCARTIPLYERYYGTNWPVTGLQYYMLGKLEWRLEHAEAAYSWLRKATVTLSLSHGFGGSTILRGLHELVHQVEVELSFKPATHANISTHPQITN